MFARVFTDIGFTETLVDFISKTRIEVSIFTICLSPAVLLYCCMSYGTCLGISFGACSMGGQKREEYFQGVGVGEKWEENFQGVGVGSAQIEPIMRQRRRRRVRITYVCSHAYGTRAGGIISLN